MKITLARFAGLLAATFPLSAAARPMSEILPTLPGDVVAAVVIPDLKQADTDYRMFLEGMGLLDDVPEEHRHPLERIKEKLPGLKGFDESGSLALLILKSSSLPELMNNVVVLLPASDTARLFEDLGGDFIAPDNDKIRSILLFGQTMYATVHKNHVAVTRSADVARQLGRGTTNLRDRLPEHEVDSLDGVDACLWLDASAILSIFMPQIDGLMGWALMMQMGAGEVGEEEARASKKQVDTFVEGLSSLLLGAAVDSKGVTLRAAASTKPGSELARQTRTVAASAPLLRGLPRRNYLAVMGFELHPETMRYAVLTGLDPVFADLRKEKDAKPDDLASLQKDLAQALEMVRSIRAAFDHQYGEGECMLGFSIVLETSESTVWLDLAERVFSKVSKMNETTDPDESDEWSPPIIWSNNAEKIEEVSISRVTIDVLADPDLTDDERENARQILGSEALTFRLAAVDSKTVACTFGGKAPQMARLIRAIRRNQSPLDDDPGIAGAAGMLTEKKSGVLFLAVDRIVNFAEDVSYATESEEPFTFLLPRVDAPIAMGMTGGDGWSRYDMFVPMPLIKVTVTALQEMEDFESEIDEPASDEESEEEGHIHDEPEEDHHTHDVPHPEPESDDDRPES